MSSEKFVGVDFSAGSKAGRSLWITVAREKLDQDGLVVERCDSAERRWKIQDRAQVLERLTEFLQELGPATAALDFPFAPPMGVFDADSWDERIRIISERCSDANDFVDRCRERFEGNKLRTTEQRRQGLCSYSPQIKYQTFHGIVDVLHALLDSNIRFEPMGLGTGKTTVIETYPAGILGEIKGAQRTGYKQQRYEAHHTRRVNVESMESIGVDFNDHRWLATADDNAFDSVLAAYGAYRAAMNEFNVSDQDYEPTEGYIYV